MAVKVSCDSCGAPYNIDERRIPAAGLRVRCPKCTHIFVIKRPDADRASALPPAIPSPSQTKFPKLTGELPSSPTGESATPAVVEPAVAAKPDVPKKADATKFTQLTSGELPGSPRELDALRSTVMANPAQSAQSASPFGDSPPPMMAELPELPKAPQIAAPRRRSSTIAFAGAPGALQDAIASAQAATKAQASKTPNVPVEMPSGGRSLADLPLVAPQQPEITQAPRAMAPSVSDLPAVGGSKAAAVAAPAADLPAVRGSTERGAEITTAPKPKSFDLRGTQATPAIGKPDTSKIDLAPPMDDLPALPARKDEPPGINLPPLPKGAAPRAMRRTQVGLGAFVLPTAEKPGDKPAEKQPEAKPSPFADLPASRVARTAESPFPDLPATRNQAAKAPEPPAKPGFGELDLPTFGDLPAARTVASPVSPKAVEIKATPVQGTNELDLPAVGKPKIPPSKGFEVPKGSPAFGEADLPSVAKGRDLPGARDLPAIGGTRDLPAIGGARDLPAIGGARDLPAIGGARDLPAIGGARDRDLPAIGGARDLPAVGGPRDLPAVQAKAPTPFGEIDLPAMGPRDLPAQRVVPKFEPTGAKTREPQPFGEIDLPSLGNRGDLPAARPGKAFGEFDLPSVGTARNTPDLPAVRPFGSVDLPATAEGRDLPARAFGEMNLPAISKGKDLPQTKDNPLASFDLPTAQPRADLPKAKDDFNSPGAELRDFGEVALGGSQGFGDIDLAPARDANQAGFGDVDLAGAPAFGEVDLAPAPQANKATAKTVGLAQTEVARSPNPTPDDGFGEFDLPPPAVETGGLSLGNPGPNLDLNSPHADSGIGLEASFAARRIPGAGSVSQTESGFGEVDLGSASGAEDDMEFGGIPQAPAGATFDTAPRSLRKSTPTAEEKPSRAKGIIGRVFGVLFAVVLVSGASLEFTKHGAFARHTISDRLNAQKYLSTTENAVIRSRLAFAEDVKARADEAVDLIAGEVLAAPRYQPLTAYAAYLASAHQLRFGNDSARASQAQQWLSKAPLGSPWIELARAANDVVTGSYDAARGPLTELVRSDPKNVDAAVTLGELEFRAKQFKPAVVAFEQARLAEDSIRTRAGLVRALMAAGDFARAKTEATALADKSPTHAGARLGLAQLAWDQNKNEVETLKWLTALEKPEIVALTSPSDRVAAMTLKGKVCLDRGRVTEARTAFGLALTSANGIAVPAAQLGLGEVEMLSGAYAKAIANFQAAAEAAPEMTEAKLGVARANLRLEKPSEAKATLSELKDPLFAGEIGFWLGQAEEKISPDKPADSMKIYEAAIKSQPTEVKPYIALAQLQAKSGRPEDADATLEKAVAAVPPTDKVFLVLGQLRFRQGRYVDAIVQFDKALALSPENLQAMFEKGRTWLRMDRTSLDKGKALLEAVEKKDPKYPGLALEMGFYFQETRQIAEALKRYESALAAAPNDIDIQLQVGRAQVESRDPNAEKTLREVLDKCGTTSANPAVCTQEAKHYLGRALLNRGAAGEALIYLQQASEKSGDSNAFYHLYYAWALLEIPKIDESEVEVLRAIELDKSLGDAYWLKSEILARRGLNQEAIDHAKQALKLHPSRHEAHGTIALVLIRMNDEAGAVAELKKAIAADPRNARAPFWRYQLADVAFHKDQIASAAVDLRESIKQASTYEPKPQWLPKAHYYLAEAVRRLDPEEAKREYRAFLDGSVGTSDPAREAAKMALAMLGAPYKPAP